MAQRSEKFFPKPGMLLASTQSVERKIPTDMYVNANVIYRSSSLPGTLSHFYHVTVPSEDSFVFEDIFCLQRSLAIKLN